MASLMRKEKEAAARYEALIGASNTGAWEYHADTEYLWCSPEYFSMLGFDIKDFDQTGKANLKQTWLELLHPEDREKALENFSSYMKNPEGMCQQNFRMRHHDGRWIWIWSRGKTLRDAEGRLTLVTVGTHIDVTERIILEDRLRQSEKMEAIGQLAGGVAHDFNNQLSGMLGFAELLAKRLEHEPQLKKMAESIMTAALRSADLTRQ
ncbi:MAG: PAS/PAC sensor signal transduction histidine kinase, partial [uncultured bacterium]